MNIDKNKFDTSLPCNLEPFGFIEKVTEVETKNAGRLSIISYGALDYNNHYSPEFGGVALVHHNPDIFMATKYIGWDAKAREIEHKRSVDFLKDNFNIEPNLITEKFYHEFDYFLPAVYDRDKKEYLKDICSDKNKLLSQTRDMYENTELKEALEEAAKEKELKKEKENKPTPNVTIDKIQDSDDYLDGEKLI